MYETVFDIRTAIPWHAISFTLSGFGLCLLGFLLVRHVQGRLVLPQWLQPVTNKLVEQKQISLPFARFFFAFALLWTGLTVVHNVSTWSRFRKAMSTGAVVHVEGTVENFHVSPTTHPESESFTVQGIPFNYSRYAVTPAFHRMAVEGGPMANGIMVRVDYLEESSRPILRLEVPRERAALAEHTRTWAPHLDVFTALWLFGALLGAVGYWLLQINTNVARKKRFFPLLLLGQSLLFAAAIAHFGVPFYANGLVLLGFVMNYFGTRFCDACGKVSYSSWSNGAAKLCEKCGAELQG